MLSFLILIYFTVCLVLIIRLFCYLKFKQAISHFRDYNNDVIYFYKKVENPKWLNVETQEQRETWKIMPKEINNKGFIALYPGKINDNKMLNLGDSITREDITFPIFRCRCQTCKIEFNCDTFCNFMVKIKNKYTLNLLLNEPKNKRKEYIFPKYCITCNEKNIKDKNNIKKLINEDTVESLDSNTTSLCYLCLDKKLEMKCFPCGCDCYCSSCSRRLVRKIKERRIKGLLILEDDIFNKCPICRSTITHFLKKRQV